MTTPRPDATRLLVHEVFPFDCPVRSCTRIASGPRRLFILGAYPSALHVRWRLPRGTEPRVVRALAVDNEPEPFWAGDDGAERVDKWREDRNWREAWGAVEPAGRLNGSSGRWVEDNVLTRFNLDRTDAWITDCLNTYRASVGMSAAVDNVYRPFAEAFQLPKAKLAKHPSEVEIVAEANYEQFDRIRAEVAHARPESVVTLGNAALIVFQSVLDEAAGPLTLAADASYGGPFEVSVTGIPMRWFPLAHPAAPPAYQQRHQGWNP